MPARRSGVGSVCFGKVCYYPHPVPPCSRTSRFVGKSGDKRTTTINIKINIQIIINRTAVVQYIDASYVTYEYNFHDRSPALGTNYFKLECFVPEYGSAVLKGSIVFCVEHNFDEIAPINS